MENKYYLPINATSLAHYFGCACLKPAKYFANKPADIQDKNNDCLLITTHRGINSTDCCLEIVITEEEQKDLIKVGEDCFLYDVKSFPISRVKKIYFTDKEKMSTTITNIRMSTAFIPDSLYECIPVFEEVNIDNIKRPKESEPIDQSEKLKKYDKFLGALSLMKIVHEDYMNYSENYIATLSFFNSLIKEQLLQHNHNMKFALQGIFTGNEGFNVILPYLEKDIREEDVEELAKKRKACLKKDMTTRIIDVKSISDTWTYSLAILNNCGVGNESRRQRIDEQIISHFAGIKDTKREGVALCYGYNRGYTIFTKDYGTNENNRVAVKFKLDSQLDYYTLESVYQYVFNDKDNSITFPYLDDWCPKLPNKEAKRNCYKILDEIIIGKKKASVLSQEWWKEFQSQSLFKEFNLWNTTLLQFCEKIALIIYQDTKNELEEKYQSQLTSYKEENNRLKNNIENVVEKKESNKDYMIDIESVIDEYEDYNHKPDTELKKLIKNNGLCEPKGAKKKDRILMLMKQKKITQRLFSNE